MKLANRLFVIQHVESKQLACFGAKLAWTSSAAAKNAFALHTTEYIPELGYSVHQKLDSTSEYQLVEISSENICKGA